MVEFESRSAEAGPSFDRLVDVLAGYLLASPRFHCPGVDGASIADVVATEYPPASAAGWVPPTTVLAARHPDLADALASFFRADTAVAC